MPLFLDACGFELGNGKDDGIIQDWGSPSYQATTFPGSLSARRIWMQANNNARLFRYWQNQPSGSKWGLVFKTNFANTNVNSGIGVTDTLGSANPTLSINRSAADFLTLLLNNAPVATSLVPMGNNLDRYAISVNQVDGQDIVVYRNDVEEIRYTLQPGEAAAIGTNLMWFWRSVNIASNYLDDCVALDLDELPPGYTILDYTNISIGLRTVVGAGARQEGTGAYTNIDEIPFNAADVVTFDTPGQGADYAVQTHPGVAYQVLGVIQSSRVRKFGPDAGENIRPYLREGGVERFGATRPCPTDGIVEELWEETRGGTPWSDTGSTAFNLHTYGLETVT